MNYNWRTKQLLMIFTITAQYKSKGMITPSVVKTVWKQKVHSAKTKKYRHHFIYLEDYVIQRQMNKQSGFNAEQIEKDKYLESKNCLKIKFKITS